MRKYRLSKSTFIRGLQCEKSLYFYKHHYKIKDPTLEGLVESLDINEMNTNQRIKVLQIALQYTLPRFQATLIKDEHEDQPLFVEDIVIYSRKEDSKEEKWINNFEGTSIKDL